MRVLVFGNSGAGKTTYARVPAQRAALEHLDLDSIVWVPGQIAVQREAAEVRAALQAFLAAHPAWVIEGCYGELIEVAAGDCTQLVFLNPGLDACLVNNRRRAWEPHKYDSPAAQDAMLAALQDWVRGYYTRDDAWSYAAHRRIYDGHRGAKIELDRLSCEITTRSEE
jgi:adenylate kinase family enzyme